MNQNNEHRRDDIQEMLSQAGPPPEIPAEDLAAIRAAARREWLALQGETGPEKADYRPLFAIAASLLLTVAVGWWWTTQRAPGAREVVATVELVRGDTTIAAAETETIWSPARGDEIFSGSSLQTSTGLIAIELAGGQSIRLDAGTEAVLASASRVELIRGAVYVDSGPGSASSVVVATPLGLVTEIGTQFEVRVGNGSGETVRVRVREGSVSLAHDGESYSASIGQQLTLDSRGEVFRAAVPVRGSEWDWVLEAAPGMEVEGHSLLSYLEWVARETGWEIQYTDAGLEEKASDIFVIGGSIESMKPQDSLNAVLPSFGLGYEIRDNTLLVGGPSTP